MNKQHEVDNLVFEGDWMILSVDGQRYRLPWAQVSERLAQATDIERQTFRIAPSGYGIHWPLIDEDLSISGLIRFAMAPTQSTETIP